MMASGGEHMCVDLENSPRAESCFPGETMPHQLRLAPTSHVSPGKRGAAFPLPGIHLRIRNQP